MARRDSSLTLAQIGRLVVANRLTESFDDVAEAAERLLTNALRLLCFIEREQYTMKPDELAEMVASVIQDLCGYAWLKGADPNPFMGEHLTKLISNRTIRERMELWEP